MSDTDDLIATLSPVAAAVGDRVLLGLDHGHDA